MLKEIQNEQLQQMKLKKDALLKEKQDEKKFFLDYGVKSSDVFYVNDDKVVEKRHSLRTQARSVATQLNDQHMSKIEENRKKMIDQA